jgi:hypothetical protein
MTRANSTRSEWAQTTMAPWLPGNVGSDGQGPATTATRYFSVLPLMDPTTYAEGPAHQTIYPTSSFMTEVEVGEEEEDDDMTDDADQNHHHHHHDIMATAHLLQARAVQARELESIRAHMQRFQQRAMTLDDEGDEDDAIEIDEHGTEQGVLTSIPSYLQLDYDGEAARDSGANSNLGLAPIAWDPQDHLVQQLSTHQRNHARGHRMGFLEAGVYNLTRSSNTQGPAYDSLPPLPPPLQDPMIQISDYKLTSPSPGDDFGGVEMDADGNAFCTCLQMCPVHACCARCHEPHPLRTSTRLRQLLSDEGMGCIGR